MPLNCNYSENWKGQIFNFFQNIPYQTNSAWFRGLLPGTGKNLLNN